jgi:hypothetical protein
MVIGVVTVSMVMRSEGIVYVNCTANNSIVFQDCGCISRYQALRMS